jgi:hemoglobin
MKTTPNHVERQVMQSTASSASDADSATQRDSAYGRLGGAPAIHRLVNRFYGLMDELPEAHAVRQIHPPSLSGSADSLFKFLSGWFGGPPLYVRERGHPRLRMRHAPYAINVAMRDEWMLCMRMALAEQVDDLTLLAAVERAFSDMANHLINSENPTGCPH